MKKISILILFIGYINIYADSLKYEIIDNNFSTQIIFNNKTLSNLKIYVLNSEQILKSDISIGVPCNKKEEIYISIENLDNHNYNSKTFYCGKEITINRIEE